MLAGFLWPCFSFAQFENPPIPQPETAQQAQELGNKAWDFAKGSLPGIIKQVWNEQVIPIWTKMWEWFKANIWEPYLAPFFQSEIEKRQPGLKTEFEKEKTETVQSAKTDVVPAIKSLWAKLMDIIK